MAVRFAGSISTEEFAALPAKIWHEPTAQKMRVLFDWRSLGNWSLENWSVAALQPWVAASHHLERIAIVHRSGWNRQAALIAAVLRNKTCWCDRGKRTRWTALSVGFSLLAAITRLSPPWSLVQPMGTDRRTETAVGSVRSASLCGP